MQLDPNRACQATRPISRSQRLVLLTSAALGAMTSAAGAADRTWVGPATGNWHTPGNWTGGTVPNDNPPVDNVFIDGGRAQATDVTLNAGATILSLTVSGGDALSFAPSAGLGVGTGALGTLSNAGAIRLIGGLNRLTLSAAEHSITGGGVIRLQNSARMRAGNGRFINVDNVIEGDGYIGEFASTAVTNHATIRANNAGQTLNIEPVELTNTGTLLATNGGILWLAGGLVPTWTNTGGTIRADDGSEVRFTDGPTGTPTVVGGTFATQGTGVVRNLSTLRLRDVANAGNLTGVEASSTIIEGGFTNSGSVNLNATGFNASLVFGAGTFALTGGGSINLNSLNAASNARVLVSPGAGSATLVNVDNTIRGQGQIIGSGTTGIVNGAAGVIDADVPGRSLEVRPSDAGGLTNNGAMRASNGGMLLLSGFGNGVFTNNSTITALDGSEVQLVADPSITGGTLATAGSGVIRNLSLDTTLTDLTIAGRFIGDAGRTAKIAGTITNLGTIELNSSDLSTTGGATVTLTGGGLVLLGGANPRILGSATFVNVNNTIRGAGGIGNNSIPIVNQGTILATGGMLTINPSSAGNFVNTGTLRALAGGTVQLAGTGFGTFDSTAGAIDVRPGGTLALRDSAVLSAGPVTLDGTWSHGTNATATVTNVRGTGRLDIFHGRVTVRAGGGTLGTSRVGELLVGGPGQLDRGQLDLTDHDLVIDYTGATPIQTTRQQLRVGYDGGDWDGFGIITTSGTAGGLGIGFAEASALFTSFPAAFSGQPVDDTSVLLRFTRFGDANLDGSVNLADFNRLASNFGATGAVWSRGDFNYDGTVNLADFNLLASNFGLSASGPDVTPEDWAALASAVPEPTGVIAFTGVAASAAMLRRRRRC
jgi:hypothetical protein